MKRDIFDEWIVLLKAHGATELAETAAHVHDNIWTAQKIVEARFGKEALSNQRLVLFVFMALKTDKLFETVGRDLLEDEDVPIT